MSGNRKQYAFLCVLSISKYVWEKKQVITSFPSGIIAIFNINVEKFLKIIKFNNLLDKKKKKNGGKDFI